MSGTDGWSAVPARDPGHVDDTADGLEARRTPGTSAAGAQDGRVHGRPAPHYGEYAPEGWVNPVIEAERRAQEQRSPEPASAPEAPAPATPAAGRFGASPLDFVLTVGLLVMGLWTVLGTFDTGQMASRARALVEQRFTTMADPSAMSLAAVLIAGSAVVLFALTAWWSVVRLRRRKWTFWVPLLGAAVWMVTLVVVLTVVIYNDPNVHAWLVQRSS